MPKGTRMLDLAAEKYGPGDKVQEKQTLGCHPLASFTFACCSGYKVATTIYIIFFPPTLAATLQIYVVFVKFKSVTEK